MVSPFVTITILCLYMAFLFLIALWGEKKSVSGRGPVHASLVYGLGLTVYYTGWTFYGSVGRAAVGGLMFLPVYIGTVMPLVFWWLVVRKMVRIKNTYRITSIADLISARYGKSSGMAALVTVFASMGIIPYIALQLKGIISTFYIMSPPESTGPAAILSQNAPILIAVLMAVFTVIFGARRLDPTEKHPGMVMAVAFVGAFKLLAFLLVGFFVTYYMFDGLGDIFERISHTPSSPLQDIERWEGGTLGTWMSWIVISTFAIMFLPRQFHMTVVENSDERHIKTAMWFVALYALLITFFCLPVAMGGILAGLPADQGDTFVLQLPFQHGSTWLSMLVFLGGFSACFGMLMIESMVVGTMLTNHIFLPLIESVGPLRFLRQYLLQCRWAAITFVILCGFFFERTVGGSYMLVSIGMISFAAVSQFAPVILGGLFWERGNKTGAFMGLGAGFLTWGYTMVLPALVKSGWISGAIVENGPWSIGFLKPEHLFGLAWVDPLTNTVFWSLLLNTFCYVLGSVCSRTDEEEQGFTEEFVGIMEQTPVLPSPPVLRSHIDLSAKKEEIERLLSRYFPPDEAGSKAERCTSRVGDSSEGRITVIQMADLCREVESTLAGAIGTAAAHNAMKKSGIFTASEEKELSSLYGVILARLRITPKELAEKIDHYQEREALLTHHAEELEQLVARRTEELKSANEKIVQQQEQLVLTARESGMMEMASGIIHNIGNAINTIGLRLESVTDLPRKGLSVPIVFLKNNMLLPLEEHLKKGDLELFLSTDEKGKKLIPICKELLDRVEQLSTRLHEDLHFIESQATHISEIVSLQQTFVGALGTEEFVDVNAVIRDSFNIWRDSLKKRSILVELDLASRAAILADKTQLAQIFVNMIKNSIEAIDEKFEGGGRVSVSTNDIEHDGKNAIEILVFDNGCGISEDRITRIFEFGVSSKKARKAGQGFGLFFCKKIVEKYSGIIDIRSRVNEFTEIRIVFRNARRQRDAAL